MDSSVADTKTLGVWLLRVAAACSRELFTDDVMRTEGIRVEPSQLATKHLNMQSNGLVTAPAIEIDGAKKTNGR